jgi:hypothetical protein
MINLIASDSARAPFEQQCKTTVYGLEQLQVFVRGQRFAVQIRGVGK